MGTDNLTSTTTAKMENEGRARRSLRSSQVLGHQPHHQGKGSRICPNLGRKGRRERPLHRRVTSVRIVRFRPRNGRERRFVEQIGTTRRTPQERLEGKLAKINASSRRFDLRISGWDVLALEGFAPGRRNGLEAFAEIVTLLV